MRSQLPKNGWTTRDDRRWNEPVVNHRIDEEAVEEGVGAWLEAVSRVEQRRAVRKRSAVGSE